MFKKATLNNEQVSLTIKSLRAKPYKNAIMAHSTGDDYEYQRLEIHHRDHRRIVDTQQPTTRFGRECQNLPHRCATKT